MNRLAPYSFTLISTVVIAIAVVAVAVVGARIGTAGLDVRDGIVLVIALAGAVVLPAGANGIRLGFVLWIWMFAVGYRTIHVTGSFALHPLVIFILFLACVLFIRVSTIDTQATRWAVPRMLGIFSAFWLLGWIIGSIKGRSWDLMITEFSDFAMLFPLMALSSYTLEQRGYWKGVVASFFCVGTLIAAIGLLEYTFLGRQGFLPASFVGTSEFAAAGTFIRSPFATWGSEAATFVCALSLPMIIPLWSWFPRQLPRVCCAGACVVELVAIYFGGFRNLWAFVALALAVVLILRKGRIGVFLTGFGSLAIYALLPESGRSRFLTLVAALQGNFQDNSIQEHWQRFVATYNIVVANPLGIGWGGSGWVHSDFMQVAGNLGVIAAIAFVVWYLATFRAFFRLYRRGPSEPLVLGLLGSFVIVGGLLVADGIEVLPQLVFPAWFVWSLVEVKLSQARSEERGSDEPHTA